MAKSLSEDLRSRLIAAVDGGMSRRGAAERFGVSVASAVRWLREWQSTGATSARPRGRAELLVQKQRLSRQMHSFAFDRRCFRDALLSYFGEARARPRRSLALRIIDWAFAKQGARAETGVCCDVCNAQRCCPKDHARFGCQALGVPRPPDIQRGS